MNRIEKAKAFVSNVAIADVTTGHERTLARMLRDALPAIEAAMEVQALNALHDPHWDRLKAALIPWKETP